MEGLFKLFERISSSYGSTFGMLFLLLIFITLIIQFLIKTFPDIAREIVQNKLDSVDEHKKTASTKRRKASKEIQKILATLLDETGADRILLFEFSNSSHNLSGMPFLFVNATYEVVSDGILSTADTYNKINMSLLASFIDELEEQGYFCIEDLQDIKDSYPVLYSILKDVKSVLFFPLYGIDTILGFISIESKGSCLNKKEILPKVTEAAQIISSLINLEDLKQKLK